MKCKICGCDRFTAHQALRVNVIVDDNNTFIDNMPEGIEQNIYESSDPYGPFECLRCGTEYDSPGISSDGSDWKITDYPYDDNKDNTVFTIDDPSSHKSYVIQIIRGQQHDGVTVYTYNVFDPVIYRNPSKDQTANRIKTDKIESDKSPVQVAMLIAEMYPDRINLDAYQIHESSAYEI